MYSGPPAALRDLSQTSPPITSVVVESQTDDPDGESFCNTWQLLSDLT